MGLGKIAPAGMQVWFLFIKQKKKEKESYFEKKLAPRPV
jgi:hypothetical protein